MSSQQDFRRYADQCKRLAADNDVAADRDALHRMADTWLQLAAEEERIADLVRAVDDLFSAPADFRHRPSWEAAAAARAH
jgi:hypothetical protein